MESSYSTRQSWAAIAGVLVAVGGAIAYPFLPWLLVSLGATGLLVGLLEGVGRATASATRILAPGTIGATRSRAAILVALAALSKATYAVAGQAWHVLAARAIEPVAEAASPNAPAADRANRKAAATALGSLVAFALALGFAPRQALALSMAPLVGALGLAFSFRDEGRVQRDRVPKPRLAREPALHGFILAASIATLASFGFIFLLLRSIGAEFTLPRVGLVFVVFASTAAVATALGRRAFKNWGPGVPLACALASLTVAHLVAAGLDADSVAPYFAAAAMFGVGAGAWQAAAEPAAHALDKGNPPAAGVATFHLVVAVSALAGGVMAGLLWSLHESFVFLVGAILAVTALAEIALLWGRGLLPADVADA